MATSTPTAPARLTDPRSLYPQPPFPRPEGDQSEFAELDPKPDHGESSYVGAGRLAGLRTLITGGDSGIGRRPSPSPERAPTSRSATTRNEPMRMTPCG